MKEKISDWLSDVVEQSDHTLHFWSGLGNLGSAAVKTLIFLAVGLLGWYSVMSPEIQRTVESHKVVFTALAAWFFITLTLLFRGYSLGKYKNLASRLGAVFAENMRESDINFKGRKRIIRKHSKKFTDSKVIHILGATGVRTFVDKTDIIKDEGAALMSPIFSTLRNDKSRSAAIEIDILLIHPDSKYAAERAAAIEPPQPYEEYKQEILEAIKYCAVLKKDFPKLRCYVYDRPPIWKLILTDTLVWQQFYKVGTHVEHSRINIFANTDSAKSGNGLYPPFKKLFELLRDDACSAVCLEGVEPVIPKLPLKLDKSNVS